jgi:hypothetical protein
MKRLQYLSIRDYNLNSRYSIKYIINGNRIVWFERAYLRPYETN